MPLLLISWFALSLTSISLLTTAQEPSCQYNGRVSTTNSRFTCQRWDSQPPQSPGYSPHHFVDGVFPENYCRIPIDVTPPWCYTTDIGTRQEPCSIPVGDTCCAQGEKVCAYTGTISTTVTGKTCQRWDTQSPHEHQYNPRDFQGEWVYPENYCRAPSSPIGPWCYISSSSNNGGYDYCIVDVTECITKTVETDKVCRYTGDLNVTRNGHKCQRWDAQFPHKHEYTIQNFDDKKFPDNFCRSPIETRIPWCYVQEEGEIRWDDCDVTDYSCCTLGDATCVYKGTMNKTERGFTCQRWDAQSPNKHQYQPGDFTAEGVYPENYCRSPRSTFPWCYTTVSSPTFELCNVTATPCDGGGNDETTTPEATTPEATTPEATTLESATDDDDDVALPAALGTVFGVLGLALIVIVVFFVIRRRKHLDRDEDVNRNETDNVYNEDLESDYDKIGESDGYEGEIQAIHVEPITTSKSQNLYSAPPPLCGSPNPALVKDESVEQPQSHIMISYNHAYRDIATKINEHLKHLDFVTWIDYEDMGNDLVDGMTEGVKFAEAVVIIMADEYERSVNCRSEAMYARDLQKNIIPIKLSSDYHPTNWLGLLIAGKMFIDFGFGELQENLESITAAIYNFRKSQTKSENMYINS